MLVFVSVGLEKNAKIRFAKSGSKKLSSTMEKNLIQLNIPDYVKNGMEWNVKKALT